MDRQIIVAIVVALSLATAIKIHPPIEAAANTETANTRIQAVGETQAARFTQPDTTWLVGP